jgi:hypothetical protein
VRRPQQQRPLRNGSSNTTFDILVALSVLGASALTLIAVLRAPRRDQPGDDRDARGDADEQGSHDE